MAIKVKENKSAFRSQKQQPRIHEINPDVQRNWTPKLFWNMYSNRFIMKIRVGSRLWGFKKVAFFSDLTLVNREGVLFSGLEITGIRIKRKVRKLKINRCIMSLVIRSAIYVKTKFHVEQYNPSGYKTKILDLGY